MVISESKLKSICVDWSNNFDLDVGHNWFQFCKIPSSHYSNRICMQWWFFSDQILKEIPKYIVEMFSFSFYISNIHVPSKRNTLLLDTNQPRCYIVPMSRPFKPRSANKPIDNCPPRCRLLRRTPWFSLAQLQIIYSSCLRSAAAKITNLFSSANDFPFNFQTKLFAWSRSTTVFSGYITVRSPPPFVWCVSVHLAPLPWAYLKPNRIKP